MVEVTTKEKRDAQPSDKLVTFPMFINDGLRYPGEVVTTDLQGEHLVSLDSKEAQPFLDAAQIQIPLAPIAPSGPAPTQPQGLPAGAIQAGNKWLIPGAEPGTYVEAVQATDKNDVGIAQTLDAQVDRAANSAEAEARINERIKDGDTTSADASRPLDAAGGPNTEKTGMNAQAPDDLEDYTKAQLREFIVNEGGPDVKVESDANKDALKKQLASIRRGNGS